MDPSNNYPDDKECLPAAAIRALREAEERRKLARQTAKLPGELNKEDGGPDGPEPTRFGDWERKGRAVDF